MEINQERSTELHDKIDVVLKQNPPMTSIEIISVLAKDDSITREEMGFVGFLLGSRKLVQVEVVRDE